MSDSGDDSLDGHSRAKARAERAVDVLREKFGRSAVERGLAFKTEEEQ